MSLRRLYKSIPKAKRICNYYRCQKAILRNIDQDKDGRIYHHGCLMAAQDERWKCLNCFMVFDATEAALSEQFSDHITIQCPECGSIDLRSLSSGRMAGLHIHFTPQDGFNQRWRPLAERSGSRSLPKLVQLLPSQPSIPNREVS